MWTYFLMTFLLDAASSNQVVKTDVLVNPGSSVDLRCTNKTWKDTFYVLYHLQLKNRNCSIQTNKSEISSSCRDGKSLLNTSLAQPVLHIPNVSSEDVGVYSCEFAYRGGVVKCETHVSVIVPPVLDAWLELRDGKLVAFCTAERGNPAANISWSLTGNQTTSKSKDSNGLFRVESSLEVPDGVDAANISCVVSHRSWQDDRELVPRTKTGKAANLLVLLITFLLAFFVFTLVVVFYAQRKLIFWRQRQKSDSSSVKPPTREEVEEVEPYASYVQRVNSIYNSSVDLFS